MEPETHTVATELSKINWPVGGSERSLCRVRCPTELISLGSLLILIKLRGGVFFLLVVHSTQNVETISLWALSSLIREHTGSVETQLRGLLEQ